MSHVQQKKGYTANYPFSYHPQAPRVFNGEILYELLPPVALRAPSTSDGGSWSDNPVINVSLAETKSFQTTFASNNGYAGNFFTIQAKVNIVVETFDVNAGSTETGLELKIYTKFGDYSRNDVDPSSTWTEVCVTTVDGQGESKPTHIPSEAVKSVAIKSNERQSFFITFSEPYMKYTSTLFDPNYYSNEDISFVASAGTQYPFAHYFENRIWNGNIYYQGADGEAADIQGQDTAVASLIGGQSEGRDDTWSYGSVVAHPP